MYANDWQLKSAEMKKYCQWRNRLHNLNLLFSPCLTQLFSDKGTKHDYRSAIRSPVSFEHIFFISLIRFICNSLYQTSEVMQLSPLQDKIIEKKKICSRYEPGLKESSYFNSHSKLLTLEYQHKRTCMHKTQPLRTAAATHVTHFLASTMLLL